MTGVDLSPSLLTLLPYIDMYNLHSKTDQVGDFPSNQRRPPEPFLDHYCNAPSKYRKPNYQFFEDYQLLAIGYDFVLSSDKRKP
jgi:hypothetical protein